MTSAILLGMIGPWQIVLIVLVFLLMFGGKKIPGLAKVELTIATSLYNDESAAKMM
ncbi:MAG: hypothetical protein HN535_02895, partial [Flavobacteriales bacterium]|nr:hypothetical protein [Flavobacteriales bacterium]